MKTKNKEVYEIFVNSWSYHSSRNEKYIGTIEELRNTLEFRSILRNHKPRTLNGLQRILNQYANKQATYYTGIAFEVFMHYGEYKAGLQE